MKPQSLSITFSVIVTLLAAGAGLAAWRYVPLNVWQPVFPGMLVALSMLGAAVLVRLARNAPITAPTAFDEADLKRFFDTLEELNKRLFWIFLQAVAAIFVVLAAVTVSYYKGDLLGYSSVCARILSGFLAALVVWLVLRVISMAKGDIGFVRLQRRVLERALERQRLAAAEKIAPAPPLLVSPDPYGRELGNERNAPN